MQGPIPRVIARVKFANGVLPEGCEWTLLNDTSWKGHNRRFSQANKIERSSASPLPNQGAAMANSKAFESAHRVRAGRRHGLGEDASDCVVPPVPPLCV